MLPKWGADQTGSVATLYNVTFDLDSGNSSLTNGWYVAGSELSDVPTKDGYTFKEWTKDGSSVREINGPGTYTATYEQNAAKYSVSINGGASFIVEEGKPWSDYSNHFTHFNDNNWRYMLNGTAITSSGTVGDLSSYGNPVQISEEVKITFATPSHGSISNPAEVWAKPNTDISKISGLPNVENLGGTGYKFTGWKLNNGGTTISGPAELVADLREITNNAEKH